MEKQTKTTYLLFGLAVFSTIVHNALYGLFKIEEPISFTLTLVFILGFAASIVFNIVTYSRKRKPKDLWKLGWIGLFGLLGLVGSPGLYGFFGFFGFFGAKKWSRKIFE